MCELSIVANMTASGLPRVPVAPHVGPTAVELSMPVLSSSDPWVRRPPVPYVVLERCAYGSNVYEEWLVSEFYVC